jgi:hypothetical protein
MIDDRCKQSILSFGNFNHHYTVREGKMNNQSGMVF